MGLLSFEAIEPPAPLATLPVRLEQYSPRLSAALLLSMLIPTAIALLAPYAILAVHVLGDANARELFAERPGAVVQIALALTVWSVLLGWPVQRGVRRLASKRTVEIDGTAVTVTDRGLTAGRTWTEPLGSYTGVAHHIRASMSGIRHELILVHSNPQRSVLVAIAPRFSQSEIDAAASLLGRPEVSSRLLYRLRPERKTLNTSNALSSRPA